MRSTLHCRARLVVCFLITSLAAIHAQDDPAFNFDFVKEEKTTEKGDVTIIASETPKTTQEVSSQSAGNTTNQLENEVFTTIRVTKDITSTHPATISTSEASKVDTWEDPVVSPSSELVTKDTSTDDTEIIPDASTQTEDANQFSTNELSTGDLTTEELSTDEDTTEEWPSETCVIQGLECVEPVQCTGQGRIDCSTEAKELLFEDDDLDNATTLVNASLDTWLPSRPRRAAFSGSRRDRKKQGVARKNNLLPVEGTEDPTETPCWIEETLLCSSGLILQNCRGVGYCKPASEEPGGSTYLADWEIAVIAVLSLAGLFLVVLLVYVIYGAWRKKKVRPMMNRNGRGHS